MSDTLRITLDEHQLSPASTAELIELCRTATGSVVPGSTASSIRLVLRNESLGTTIEPFMGSASFDALLGNAKKRDQTLALLGALIRCAFHFSARVGILRNAEGVPPPRERAELSIETLPKWRKIERGWYRIVAHSTWFHFGQVEAKLLQPLRLRDGERATHYFREFWVRAVDKQIASDVVTRNVASDGATVVTLGVVLPDGSPPPGRGDTENVIARGRIYFSDRAN